MRTKEYDVQFNDGRLSIVRLRDGAPVVDSVEIPADAVGAAVQVLSRTGVSSSRSEPELTAPVGSLEQPAVPASGTSAPSPSAEEKPAPKRARKKKTVE